MNVVQFQVELCKLLKQEGWIADIAWNYQDLKIDWTAKGQQLGTDFMENVQGLRPGQPWTAEELASLRAFGIYVGFIEPSRRDLTQAAVKPFIQHRNLLVISTAPSNRRRYRLFTAKNFQGFYDYIEAEQDAGRELMLISVADILLSDVGRAFPFGKPEAEGKTVWQRGP